MGPSVCRWSPLTPVALVISQPAKSRPGTPMPRAVMSAPATQVLVPAAAASASVQVTASAKAAPTLKETAVTWRKLQAERGQLMGCVEFGFPLNGICCWFRCGTPTSTPTSALGRFARIGTFASVNERPKHGFGYDNGLYCCDECADCTVAGPKGPKNASCGPEAKDTGIPILRVSPLSRLFPPLP